MTFDAQKYPQTRTDMIMPRLATTHLPAFDQTKLLQSAFDCSICRQKEAYLTRPKLAHFNLIGRPMFRCAVCGFNPKHSNESEIFEPNNFSLVGNRNRTNPLQTCSVRINQAISFQSGQKMPAQRAAQFQILPTGIPTVKTNHLRIRAARAGARAAFPRNDRSSVRRSRSLSKMR